MECNKDEAFRVKSIAEDKLDKKDFAGARKFAMKAYNLFPGLDGISQMLTTIDVYISAENKISGEVDWYGVLGLDPSADDEAIKKQYRKLALKLHPDKNKSVGADGVFMLISEAFGVLSDKAKRLAYNHRRRLIRASQDKSITTPKSQMKTTEPPAPAPRPSPSSWSTYRRWRRVCLDHTFPCNKPFTVFLVIYFVVLIGYAKKVSVTRVR